MQQLQRLSHALGASMCIGSQQSCMSIRSGPLVGWLLQVQAQPNAAYHIQPALYGQAAHPEGSYSQHQYRPAELGAYSQPQQLDSGWNGSWPHAQQPYTHPQLFSLAQVHRPAVLPMPATSLDCCTSAVYCFTNMLSSVLWSVSKADCVCCTRLLMHVCQCEFGSSGSLVHCCGAATSVQITHID